MVSSFSFLQTLQTALLKTYAHWVHPPETEVDILFIGGFFHYGNSFSGDHVILQILKNLPFSCHTLFVCEEVEGYPYIPIHKLHKKKGVSFLKHMPRCKVLVIAGDVITLEQMRCLKEIYQCEMIWVGMGHDFLSDGGHYPEIRDAFTLEAALPRKAVWDGLDVHVVVVSSWSLSLAHKAPLYYKTAQLIPIPFEAYPTSLQPKLALRERYGIAPEHTHLILWGTTNPFNPRKGWDEFQRIIQHIETLHAHQPELGVAIVAIGDKRPWQTDLPVYYLGETSDRTMLSDMYRMCDVFACTSLTDAGPMMIVESLANETPVVSFDTNISLDIIQLEQEGWVNGRVIPLKEGHEPLFAQALWEILTHGCPINHEMILAFNARASVHERWHALLTQLITPNITQE
ncbi:MAG: glycosyltransferase [Vampirovibrionales bacterium]